MHCKELSNAHCSQHLYIQCNCPHDEATWAEGENLTALGPKGINALFQLKTTKQNKTPNTYTNMAQMHISGGRLRYFCLVLKENWLSLPT